MPLLPDISVPLVKPQRSWLLTEHFLFVPLCAFGLWQPLTGLVFIFSVMGLFFSRNSEFLPGLARHKQSLQRVLRLLYGAALMAALLLTFWPLSGGWQQLPQSEDFSNTVITSREDGALVVLHGGAGTIQVHQRDGDAWRDLAYPGGHGWRMVSAEGALWIIPSEATSFYVLRQGAWERFTRPGGYCDSFEVSDGTLWLTTGGQLYRSDTTDVALARVASIERVRYVAARGDIVMVGGYQGWYQSEDRGQTWSDITPEGEDATAEPYLSADGRRYWLVSGVFSSALYASSAGQPLTKRTVPVRDARALVLNPDDGQELWLGSWEAGVFRSRDGGVTWLDMGLQRVQVRSMAVDFQRRLVFAASANLLFDKYIFERSF